MDTIPKIKSESKDQVHFPEVNDIFHLPDAGYDKEVSLEGIRNGEHTEVVPKVKPQVEIKPMATPPAARPNVQKSQILIEIESIMEENLNEIYQHMPKEIQLEFQKEGEEAAEEIQTLLGTVKGTTKKIIEILRQWLMKIPGVNKHFLNQEAKIKADKIIMLHFNKINKIQKK